MNKITSFLTFLVMAALAISACAPQSSNPAKSTTPEATPIVAPTSGQSEATLVPPITPPVVSTGGGQMTEVAPEPTGTSAVIPLSGGQTVVTLDDQGKRIQMEAGQSFLLKLGEVYAWEVTVSDQNVVSRVRNIAVVRGAQGVYNALQAGTATLTATGDPQCRQSKPACGMPSLLFTVTVVVK